jgi:hypothetical protein
VSELPGAVARSLAQQPGEAPSWPACWRSCWQTVLSWSTSARSRARITTVCAGSRWACWNERDGDVDQAVAAYREHGRLVAAETPTQLKQVLLADWWQAPSGYNGFGSSASRTRPLGP